MFNLKDGLCRVIESKGFTKLLEKVTINTRDNFLLQKVVLPSFYNLFSCRPKCLTQWFSGLKEYIEANPALKAETPVSVLQAKVSDMSSSNSDFEDLNVEDDEFYDAVSTDSSSESDEEETNKKVRMILFTGSNIRISLLNLSIIIFSSHRRIEKCKICQVGKVRLKNVSWAIAGLALKKLSGESFNLITQIQYARLIVLHCSICEKG